MTADFPPARTVETGEAGPQARTQPGRGPAWYSGCTGEEPRAPKVEPGQPKAVRSWGFWAKSDPQWEPYSMRAPEHIPDEVLRMIEKAEAGKSEWRNAGLCPSRFAYALHVAAGFTFYALELAPYLLGALVCGGLIAKFGPFRAPLYALVAYVVAWVAMYLAGGVAAWIDERRLG